MTDHASVSLIRSRHTRDIFQYPNVVGVGTGYKLSKGERTDELCLVTLVRQKMPLAALPESALIPKKFDGVRTDVVEVGELKALQAPTARFRPAPGGVSVGHFKVSAGTLGSVVRDKHTNERLILSNNHVLANSNQAAAGDAIVQPGVADGGSVEQDTIARLLRFIPIDFGEQPGTCDIASLMARLANIVATLLGSSHRLQPIQVNNQATNLVDAALARPLQDGDVLDEILQIGEVNGTLPPELGMPVRKFGRTTSLTTGEILVMDATVSVNFGAGKTARFEQQLVSGAMSQGGDSGSLVVSGDPAKAVGLLFAGSNQSTIFSPIQFVLDALEITI